MPASYSAHYLDRGEGGTRPEVADPLDVFRQRKGEGAFVDGDGDGSAWKDRPTK